MTDINDFTVCGPVAWHQNWEPKQWGGTIALRIALQDIPDGMSLDQQIFCKVSYKQADANSPRLKAILKRLEEPNAVAMIAGGTLVNKKPNGFNEVNYSINTTLANFNIISDSAPVNQCSLYGSVDQTNGDWLLLKTSYRNPKADETMYRETWVYNADHNKISKPGKWRFVTGKLVTKGFDGQPATFVFADTVI